MERPNLLDVEEDSNRKQAKQVDSKLDLTEILNLKYAPGLHFNPKQQCQKEFGQNFGICAKKASFNSENKRCRTLWCGPANGVFCKMSKFGGALNGSKCGEDKICWKGECIDSVEIFGI